MSDYAAQFQRSYLNPPPRGYPGNRVQPPTHSYSYTSLYNSPRKQQQQQQQQQLQHGYAPRFDYYNSPMQMQPQYANAELQRRAVSGMERVATDIQKQWNYATGSGNSSHRKATDPLPPVPLKLQGAAGYPYTVSSAHSTPIKTIKHNPSTSTQYNPVHRSKSLAVPRPKVHTAPSAERSNTPPPSKPGRDERGLMNWNRIGTTEIDKTGLPKSFAFPNTKTPIKASNERELTLADILVESVPVEKNYEGKTVPIEHERRRSSDDILDTSKYIQENRPIDEYVSLTGTRKKSKSRRVSDPFAGLLPGKSQSADQLDAQFDSPQTGLRSREESIEKLRGSYNNSDSAFTAKLGQPKLPSPTSSEEELRGITGLRGGAAVKRSRSLSSGAQRRPKESGFSPRHARVKILSNNMSSSLDSRLEQSPGSDRAYVSKYQEASPVYAYAPKKGVKSATSQKEVEVKSNPGKVKRPQPSIIDPAAIRHALIEELKSGHFNLSPSTREPQYAVVKKEPKREKVSTKKPGLSSNPLSSLVERGIQAARTGDLEGLKGLLMSEHIDNPHLVDKRTAIHRNFNLFTDASTESNLVHVISESGSAGCLKWLVFFAPEGACVALNKDRFVPAILAIRKGSLECVKILVMDGQIPLSIQELGNETLLHHAAYIGQTEILKWLLDYLKESQGNVIKDSDLQDSFGVTPVHFAAQKGYLDCLQVLQDAMCNLWTMDQHQQTPMDWAMAARQELAANYLILVRSVRYLSDQLNLERKHNQRLQEKMALTENASSKLKEEFEEQMSAVREEYESRRKDLQHDFLRLNEHFLKEGKEGKEGKHRRRRGVFRTFSLPAKHGQKKLQREANFNSTEESSPEEPKREDKLFPPDLANQEIDAIDTPAQPKDNEGKLSTIDEVSHRDSVLQHSEEATPLKIGVIQEITIAESSDHFDREIAPVPDVDTLLSTTRQKLTEEGKLAYRSSPDPFTTEGSSLSTPENTLQRKKRNVFGFKTPSKTSLKEDSISRKSTEGSLSSRVGESTGCHDKVVTTLKRIFSHSSHQERIISLPIQQQQQQQQQPQQHQQQPQQHQHQTQQQTHQQHQHQVITQSDQVTLQTVQQPLSPNLIETDFIADSEYSSHASVSMLTPHRTAPNPPQQGRKTSYVQATEQMKQFANTQQHLQNAPTFPYANAQSAQYPHPQQAVQGKRLSYPGLVTGSQNKLHKLEPYSRQAERLLDSGYLAQSSDSLDAIRQRPKRLVTNPARVTQGYSAPNPQGYFSMPSTPQKETHRNVSWPNSIYSPQRAASIHGQTNPYQQTQYSRPAYGTQRSTTISDL